MTYTPGKWRKEGLSVVVDQRGIICKCPTPQNGGVFNVVDNLDLIEAAPAMYEALDKAETRLLIFKEMPSCLWDEDDEEVLKEVRQALAAASGAAEEAE